MFDALTRRFDGVFGRLKGRGRLTADDIDEALREIRIALFEADVNVGVTNRLLDRLRARCTGEEVATSLTPGQQVVKIVNAELATTLGGEAFTLAFERQPTVILLAGLQGSGKTTAAAKLAVWAKAQGRNPLLIAADLQRPAAVEQLRTLAEPTGVAVWSADGLGQPEPTDFAAANPVEVAGAGIAHAQETGRDVVIVDTAGRLAVDVELMTQVAQISDAVTPTYTLLVVDSMMGQDAVATAQAFHSTLEVDAVVLTKLDGDARGGAALSVSEVLGRPVAFASIGEKIDEFEAFHPERMATRILGMGDVMTLIERAERVYDADEAAEAAQRLVDGSFTLDDFIDQLNQVRKMGSLTQVASMIPGVGRQLDGVDLDDGRVATVEAIVSSMTPAERADPQLIDGSRRARIARGSGTTPSQVTNLLKQFAQMRQMMNQLGGFGTKRRAAKKRGRASGNPKGGRKGGRTGGGRATGRTPAGAGRTTPIGRPTDGQPPGIDLDALDFKLPGT